VRQGGLRKRALESRKGAYTKLVTFGAFGDFRTSQSEIGTSETP
jgi:hypothetical protein